MSANVREWEETIGDQVFVFRGDRDSNDQAKRAVVSIRSCASLLNRQIGAHLPIAYRKALLASWDDARSNPGARAIVQHYVAHPINSLYLYGPTGRGKSFMACAISNALLERGKAVKFQPVGELLLDLRDTFSAEGTSEKSILGPLGQIQFLVLDELGDVPGHRDRTASAFSASRILILLDARWRAGKPTIVTSNLDLQELEKWIDDPRLASRIAGMCGLAGIVEICGRDLRVAGAQEKAKQLQADKKARGDVHLEIPQEATVK